jgi:predicted RNA-binding protein with PUA-like domain
VRGGHLFHRLLDMTPQTWLMKSEPNEASIDDLAREGRLPWTGVRNHQARNFMRDAFRLGDRVLFYHSSCAEPGIAGLGHVASAPYPDPTQFDPSSSYFDPKSAPASPRWLLVDVAFVAKTPLLSLAALRSAPELADLAVLQRGNRLSITPITPDQWRRLAVRLGVPA